ncbi:MAG: hypothetical protein IPP08_02475 [Chlorobiota bacterium]|nr:hypothetical protein [Chlorobiota bacterium]QQS67059.1 MAG: hypothetical protein IPP08_02475 [Chlorobiota bacterium]
MNNNAVNITEDSRPSPLWLAFWAGADKVLPLIYGVAMVLIPLKTLPQNEWAIWTVTQMIFMIISIVADFFVLQPMVKLGSETKSGIAPLIVASTIIYTLFCLTVTWVVILFALPLETLFKTPNLSFAFPIMALMILSTIIRNISIRILQIFYRIATIFIVDLAYFLPIVWLMYWGYSNNKLNNAELLINYNYYAFILSSLCGFFVCTPDIIRSLKSKTNNVRTRIRIKNEFITSFKKIIQIGIHQGGTGILTVLQQQGDVAIVSAIRGGTVAGIYNAARLFYRTFDAIRDAVQLLLVPAVSRANSTGKHESVEAKAILATALLFVFFLPITVSLIFLAPVIVDTIMPKYSTAVHEFQWLFTSGVAMPFIIVPSAVLLGIGKSKELFYGTLIGTIILLLSGIILTWFEGSVGMAQGVSIGTFATAILLTQKMNEQIHFTLKSVLKQSKRLPAIFKQTIIDLTK